MVNGRVARASTPQSIVELGRSGRDALGHGPGPAIGAALALRGSGKVVVSLQGDGDLLYTPKGLWTRPTRASPCP
jgi:thiamine pyrophosphate-dependent acetolactate synthase large subunit-like protein